MHLPNLVSPRESGLRRTGNDAQEEGQPCEHLIQKPTAGNSAIRPIQSAFDSAI